MFKKIFLFILFLFMSLFFTTSNASSEPLFIFCGAAFKHPMKDVISLYKQKKKEVDIHYASVTTLLSQALLTKQGDVFIVPSPDIMEKAIKKGVVIPESVKNFGFVVPAINVQKGNPKNIHGLKDLARPGIRVGLANPEIVYVGAIATEIIENALTPQEKKAIQENIVTYAEDFNKLSTLLILNHVDAIIGFHFLERWYPDKVSTVKFKANEIARIGSIQVGIIAYTNKRKEAENFIDFLLMDGKEIFKKYHYFGTAEEAFQFVGEKKPIGGEFKVITNWLKK